MRRDWKVKSLWKGFLLFRLPHPRQFCTLSKFFSSSFTPKRRFSLDLRQVDLIIIINNQYMGEKFFPNTKASEASFNEDAVQS